MILTKRSVIMQNYFNHPRRTMYVESALEWLFEGRIHMMPELVWPLPNVWLGVSMEDQRAADERIPLLLETPAAVRFLSCEPLLGPVDLWGARYANPNGGKTGAVTNWPGGLDWVIVGGESGPKARPMHPDWVRDVRDQCLAGNIPFFFKQWGEWGIENDPYYHNDLSVYKEDFRGKLCKVETITSTEKKRIGNIHYVAYGNYNVEILKKVGKKKAGRELDGMVWDEFPEMAVNE
jgi:protein gp37